MNIKEIAKLTGYSVATVSRVLNNDKNVRESTRKMILGVIEENDYTPNEAARHLRTEKSYTILVVIRSLRNAVFQDIIDGIYSQVLKENYRINIFIPNETTDYTYYKALLKSRTVDGIIFVASSIDRENYLKLKNDKVVMCSEFFTDIDMEKISINHEKAAYEVAEIAIQKGFSRLKYIRSSNQSNSTNMREKGIKRALNDFDKKLSDEVLEVIDGKGEEFEGKIEELLRDNEDINCLMFHTGERVLEAAKVAKELGRDIQFVSFDDIYPLSFIAPMVLRVSSENKRIGEIAADLMLKKIEDQPYEKVYDLAFLIKD